MLILSFLWLDLFWISWHFSVSLIFTGSPKIEDLVFFNIRPPPTPLIHLGTSEAQLIDWLLRTVVQLSTNLIFKNILVVSCFQWGPNQINLLISGPFSSTEKTPQLIACWVPLKPLVSLLDDDCWMDGWMHWVRLIKTGFLDSLVFNTSSLRTFVRPAY